MPDFISPIRELIASAFGPLPGARASRSPSLRRVLSMLLFLPLLAVLLAAHWLGLLLDELLFPGYRKVAVRAPLFVVGPPRSGTTFLHALLARDNYFTTFSTWECLFAPSICQRKAILALGALDRRIGAPLGRGLGWLTRCIARSLDDIHPIDLTAPEEDYLALLPVLGTFILAIPFPTAQRYWRLAEFDRAMPKAAQRRLLRHYRRTLQRHLYVHGGDDSVRLLSKNASFAPLLGALLEEFTDARVICCLRDPLQALPSQLSAIRSGVRLFDSDPDDVIFPPRITRSLRYCYENLLEHLPALPPSRRAFVEMAALQAQPEITVRSLYATLGLDLSPQFAERLTEAADAARGYRSRHRYALADFGLDELTVRREFADVYARYPAAQRQAA